MFHCFKFLNFVFYDDLCFPVIFLFFFTLILTIFCYTSFLNQWKFAPLSIYIFTFFGIFVFVIFEVLSFAIQVCNRCLLHCIARLTYYYCATIVKYYRVFFKNHQFGNGLFSRETFFFKCITKIPEPLLNLNSSVFFTCVFFVITIHQS